MRTFLFILLHISFIQGLWGQTLPMRNYTTHDGLPQIQVQRLMMDSKGYIWIGTKGGLAKFNGEKFDSYLRNKYIYEIRENANQTIYCSTLDSIYRIEQGEAHGLASVNGRESFIMGNNRFWLANKHFIREFRADTLYKIFATKNYFLTTVNDLAYNKQKKHLLVSTANGKIFALEKGEFVEKVEYKQPVFFGEFDDKTLFYYYFHPCKELPYGYGEGIIQAFSPKDNSTFFKYKCSKGELTPLKIGKIPVSRHLITYDYQHFAIDNTTQSLQKIPLPMKEEVYALLIDRDNNYWMGTDNGLYQVNNKCLRMYPRSFMNDFWTLIQGRNGEFYGGKYKGGLFKIDMEHLTMKEIFVKGTIHKKEDNFYFGASKDKKENLYFPTHFGLVKYDYQKTKKFDTGISLFSTYDSLSNKIAFGKQFGIGFIDYNEHIEIYTDSTKKIVPTHPSVLSFRKDGNVWVGSRSSLAWFDVNSKRFHSVASKYRSYPKGAISMARDYKRNLWIGAQAELWLYDPAKDSFTQVGKDFFQTSILSIIAPTKDLLLIGTSYEIFALKLDELYKTGNIVFKMFNYRNGFFSEEIAQNGFLQANEKIYIPSSTSTTVFDYKKLSFKPNFFDVYISQINEKDLPNINIQKQKPTSIIRGKNTVLINFETVGFGLPTQSQFRYRLLGVDKQWSNWTSKKQVYYSNLSSGKYTFQVIAQNGSNIAPQKQATRNVDFIISLPFYKEPNFYKHVLIAMSLLGLFILYFSRQSYRNKLGIIQQERRVKLLEVATLQAQINPHFIFNFLASIQSLISQRNPEKANMYLVKFSRLIRSYMESSIKSSKILTESSIGNENTIKEEIELLKTYIELERMKYPEGKIKFQISWKKENLLNKTIPPLILQPFVENAIKHGILPKEGAGTVSISFAQEGKILVCTIADDGIGRLQAEKRQKHSIKAYKSRGLQLIKERVEMLNMLDYNINISYEDLDEQGTIVRIKIHS